MGDLKNVRRVVLEVLNEKASSGPGHFQAMPILTEVSNRLGIRGNAKEEQAVLTVWHDLFRVGMIAPGFNLSNPELPFIHLTKSGRRSLEQVSRDPTNPDGYLAYLSANQLTDEIAISYIQEAVHSYNSACHKSAAVMVGCATERLVLLVRDELVAGFSRKGKDCPSKLKDWRYKTARDAISVELDDQAKHMQPRRLKEAYEGFWSSFTEQPRLYRNDAGHPKSVDPVTPETVHSNLLLFPELAKLVADLLTWIGGHYK